MTLNHVDTKLLHCENLPSRASLAGLLASSSSDRSAVYKSVHEASDAELVPFGLRAFHINLLSLFGETWSPEKIAITARAAAISKMLGGWEYHHEYLPSLTSTPDTPRLRKLPVDLINDTLALGRGLLIVTFHLGHMRYLASDLAHVGIPICGPLALDAFIDFVTARDANPDAALWKMGKFFNVEENGGTFALAKHLGKGGCLISTIDGNTGLDGPRGDQRRTTVRILNSTARVKIGLLSLAARFGSPVLIMTSYTSEGERMCQTAPVIDPGHALSNDEADLWVEETAQVAYSFFGNVLLDHADEWCGGDLFHQWRVPSKLSQLDTDDVTQKLSQTLRAGGRVIVNQSRIVPLSDDRNLIWTDAMTGSCYKLPTEMAVIIRQLAVQNGGVDAIWLSQYSATEKSRLWAFLCQLAVRDVIRAVYADDV
jgi:hypothetical protein